MSKPGMTKKEISVAFAELTDRAYRMKGPNKGRFLPMVEKRNDKLYEFGMYDFQTKRYALECIHSPNAQKVLGEVRAMLDAVAK